MVNITCALLCVRTESAVRKRHMLSCLQNDWPNAYTVAELLFASFDHITGYLTLPVFMVA